MPGLGRASSAGESQTAAQAGEGAVTIVGKTNSNPLDELGEEASHNVVYAIYTVVNSVTSILWKKCLIMLHVQHAA
jgi:hypothetical protein